MGEFGCCVEGTVADVGDLGDGVSSFAFKRAPPRSSSTISLAERSRWTVNASGVAFSVSGWLCGVLGVRAFDHGQLLLTAEERTDAGCSDVSTPSLTVRKPFTQLWNSCPAAVEQLNAKGALS